MRSRLLTAIVGVCAAILFANQHASLAQDTALQEAASQEKATAEQKAAESAIRAASKEFADAFAKGDAAAIAALWAPNGVYIDERGEQFIGREAIRQEYADWFKQYPDQRLAIEIDSIRLLNADSAIEEGRAAIEPQPPGAPRVMSRYTAIHTRQDGKWLLADVRDSIDIVPEPPGSFADLQWLSGAWKSQNGNSEVDVTYRWIANKRFLSRVFAAHQGNATTTGLEVIGVDPATRRITSWSFTSDGGSAIGNWYPHNEGWIVEYEGFMGDGTSMSATNSLTKKSDDRLEWKSEDRVVGGRRLAETKTVVMEREISDPDAR